jgi:hypothetical protein
VPQSQSAFVVHVSRTQPVPPAPGVHRVFIGHGSPVSSHGIGSQRPVVSLQRVPSAQTVSGQRGMQYEQHPPEQISPSQSASLVHSDAHPEPPQIDPIVQLPHAQSVSATQSSAEGV